MFLDCRNLSVGLQLRCRSVANVKFFERFGIQAALHLIQTAGVENNDTEACFNSEPASHEEHRYDNSLHTTAQ
jgi:hypothetical protein